MQEGGPLSSPDNCARARWPDWLKALAVLGGLGAISALHVLAPLPATAKDMGLHGLHSALEGLYFVPLLLAGYWWGRSPALLCGLAASLAYGIHVETQLGGLLEPVNRGRVLALFMFPLVAFVTGHLAARLREEGRVLVDTERNLRRAELLAALGEMTAGLAHEIRNPLSAIRGSVEVLAQSRGLEARDREFVDLLLSEVGRLETLVAGFLAFARPARPGADRADPLGVARVTLALLRTQAERQRVDVGIDAPPEVSPVRCPEESLRQVLLNLCLNALQAMAPSGGSLRVRLTEAAEDVTIAVEDTGPGIPAEERERVFHPFVTTKPQGTGLGLSVAARAVHACEGSIDIGDSPGGGARVVIRLPRAPEHASDSPPDIVG